MKKNTSKIISTAFEKTRPDENAIQARKTFTPKGAKIPIENQIRNVKPFMGLGF